MSISSITGASAQHTSIIEGAADLAEARGKLEEFVYVIGMFEKIDNLGTIDFSTSDEEIKERFETSFLAKDVDSLNTMIGNTYYIQQTLDELDPDLYIIDRRVEIEKDRSEWRWNNPIRKREIETCKFKMNKFIYNDGTEKIIGEETDYMGLLKKNMKPLRAIEITYIPVPPNEKYILESDNRIILYPSPKGIRFLKKLRPVNYTK